MGIVAGLTLQMTSNVFTSMLGMYGSEDSGEGSAPKGARIASSEVDITKQLEDGESSPDSDSFWGSGSKKLTPPTLSKRRVPGQLLRETIHEEEDDDEDEDSI